MTEHVFLLKGRTAIIAGGTTGLSLAIVECMVKAGARVAVLNRRTKEEGQSVLKEIREKAVFYHHDITNTGHAPKLVDQIIREMELVTILVNNAGNHCKKFIEDMTVEDCKCALDVHLVGAFALTEVFFGHMKEQGKGSIIFQASMTSYIGQPQMVGYSTAEAGHLGLVHALAAEGGAYGVRVNAVAPGWIEIPMYHQATDNDEARRNKIIGRIPMKRIDDPADIGMAAVFLASDAAGYVSGTCLPVDGGALIGF